MDRYLLLSLRIVHGHFIVTAAPGSAVGFQAADHTRTWQSGRWFVGPIINPARNNGQIRVAFDKINNYLFINSGDVDAAKPHACMDLADPYPAGAFIVFFPFPVPVKLHLYTSMVICMNLFTGRAYHNGCLDTFDYRLWSPPRWTIGYIKGDALKTVDVSKLRYRIFGRVSLSCRMTQ